MKKRYIGWAVLIVGLIGILYSVNCMKRISEAKKMGGEISGMFSGMHGGKAVGNAIQQKTGAYDTTVTLMLVGSIVMVLIGGSTLFLSRKKRR